MVAVFSLMAQCLMVGLEPKQKTPPPSMTFHCPGVPSPLVRVNPSRTEPGPSPASKVTTLPPLRPSMIVLETVYNPEQTLLVKEARERRCRVLTGVEMFVRQAAVQFRHFAESEPPIDRMRNSLKGATGAVKGAVGGGRARR